MFLRLRGAGFHFLAAVCVGGPPPLLPGAWWPPCRCVAGWCGAFRDVRRLGWVRPSVSVPCFGVVACCGAPCCVLRCFTVVRRAGPSCVAVRAALSCCVAPCPAVVCRAVPRRAASCCGLCCLGVPRRGVLHGGALRCGVPLKPSDEHGDETQNIVSLQTVINVYHKCDKSLQIKQYQIIQCMYMRPMGWSGYTPPLK